MSHPGLAPLKRNWRQQRMTTLPQLVRQHSYMPALGFASGCRQRQLGISLQLKHWGSCKQGSGFVIRV